MSTQTIPMSNQMSVVSTLAALLESIEQRTVAPDARQYQGLIQRLGRELATVEGDPLLPALLDAYPATALVYENLHYEHAGLCRSDLDAATGAELQAAVALRRAAQPTADKGSAHS